MMKKTKQEINKFIDQNTTKGKKYNEEKFEGILNLAFLDEELKNQKPMLSKIDLSAKTTTIQKNNYIESILTGFFSKSLYISKLFFQRNIILFILTLIFSLTATLVTAGLIPTEVGPGFIEDPISQYFIASKIYYFGIFIPMIILMLWSVPWFILGMREDNLITRLKIKGFSEIQLLITIFACSFFMMIIFNIVIWNWMSVVNEVGIKNHIEEWEGIGYFRWDLVMKVKLWFYFIGFSAIMSVIGILIGFKVPNLKVVIIILFTVLIAGYFSSLFEFVVYKDSNVDESETPKNLVLILSLIRVINIPFFISSSIQFCIHHDESGITQKTLNSLNNLHNVIFILSIIISFVSIGLLNKKIVSYQPLKK